MEVVYKQEQAGCKWKKSKQDASGKRASRMQMAKEQAGCKWKKSRKV